MAFPPPLPPSPLARELEDDPDAFVPLGDPWRRISARILDRLLFAVSIVPGLFLAVAAGRNDPLVMLGGLLATGGVPGFVAYQGYLLATEGQSLGKRMLGLRIVRADDGGNPGFAQAVLIRTVLAGVLSTFLSFLFVVPDLLSMFLRADRRALHDLMAGTEVIDETFIA